MAQCGNGRKFVRFRYLVKEYIEGVSYPSKKNLKLFTRYIGYIMTHTILATKVPEKNNQ